MGNNNKGKRKLLTQRHVCSRMNFLYQAASLMAHGNNNTLAAYYGKLCRNVGTKALMHMSPAIKRTLCKRCSMPLLPGVNTTLKLEEKVKPIQLDQQKPKENVRSRHRRLRGKRHKAIVIETPSKKDESTAILDGQTCLQLECSLCGAHRRFAVNMQNECWLDRTDAIVQVLTLDRQTDDDGKKQRENVEEGDRDGEEL